MLKRAGSFHDKADRACTRSAANKSGQLNVSIRARKGEWSKSNQKSWRLTIDKFNSDAIICAIELTALSNILNKSRVLAEMLSRMRMNSGNPSIWFVGVRVARRFHPWDEQELSFQSCGWVDVEAATSADAHQVAQQLFQIGCRKAPIYDGSASAKHVFAYLLPNNSLNQI